MKKTLSTVLALTLALMIVLFSCTAMADEHCAVLTRILETGKMTAALNCQAPPWRFHIIKDGEDTLAGFEVSMMYGFADFLSQKFGVEIKVDIQDMTFPGVLAALQADQCDIAPSLAATAERRENMDFSIPYHRSLQTVVIRVDRKDDEIFKPENMLKGALVSGLQGSSTVVTFSEHYPEAEVMLLDSNPDQVLAIANKKADAGIFNEKYAILICKANPELMIDYNLAFDIPVERDPGSSLAFPKGSDELVALADEWLTQIKADGTFTGYETEAIMALDDPSILDQFSTLNILGK